MIVRGRQVVVAAALLGAGLPVSGQTGREPDRRVVFRWPSPEFRSLQEVIDAAPDGATVRIAAGIHRISEPLFVRGKGLTIDGAGCDERPQDADPRTGERTRTESVTRLVGPPPARAVPAESATGVLNYLGGGGVLRGVKLSGFDAGVVGRDLDGGAKPLAVHRTCVMETGYGVVWQASALLTMTDSLFRDVLASGIYVESLVPGSGGVHLAHVGVANADNSCDYFVNTSAYVENALHFACGGEFGIAALNSSVQILSSTVQSTSGPGIYLEQSYGSVAQNTVGFNHIAGILLVESGQVAVFGNEVFNTLPIQGDFGDGIIAFLSDAVLVNNNVYANSRAGVANFSSTMVLQSNHLSCNGFDLNGETITTEFMFYNAGDNGCGCPFPVGACVAQSSGLQAPTL
jgi:parallel beta-helix repeat protein